MVTLKDVAERAGVSIRTVSNVVNEFPHVAPAMRERVQRVLDEMGYQPNLSARNLRRGRSGLIGLVVPAIDAPYFAELTHAFVTAAVRHGVTVVVDQTDGDPGRERELVTRRSKAALFDGIVFSPLALTADDLRDRAVASPLVLLGEHITESSVDHVVIDNVAAARRATEHLLEIGRRRIAAIGTHGGHGLHAASLRAAGYRAALAVAGLPADPGLAIETADVDRAAGARAMADLLEREEERPDAVFCYNDLIAIGAMRTLLSRGLRIPEDVAVIGIDGIQEGRFSTPTLSTIAPDKQQIADRAMALLLARIDGTTEPPVTEHPGFELTLGESTIGRRPPQRRPQPSPG